MSTSREPTGSRSKKTASPPMQTAGLPTLSGIKEQLGLIRSIVAVTAQSRELDDDISTVLKLHVIDALSEQMAEIEVLLSEVKDEDDGDGGAA